MLLTDVGANPETTQRLDKNLGPCPRRRSHEARGALKRHRRGKVSSGAAPAQKLAEECGETVKAFGDLTL